MWLIFQKEMQEIARDKRTLFFMIALPMLIFPLIFAGFGYFAAKTAEDEHSKVLKYALIGGEYNQAISQSLTAAEDFELVNIGDTSIAEAVEAETVDFVLEIPSEAAQPTMTVGQVVLKVHFKDSSSSSVYGRLQDLVEGEVDAKRSEAFWSVGVGDELQEGFIEPLKLEKVDLAEKRERVGEIIGGLVPYMLLLICMQGAMMPAVDIGAGEKERGTLETLLISPMARTQLVLGKFMTIGVAGIVAAMMTVASMAIWGIIFAQGMALEALAEFLGAIGVIDFILMFLMLVPIAAIFAALLLSLSIYARSAKEAQSYMGSLIMVVILPAMLAMLPGVDLSGGWAWVPLTNVAIAIKEIIKGTFEYIDLISIFASSTILATALVAFSVNWFQREKVLFR